MSELNVKTGLDASGFETGLARLQSSAAGVARGLAATFAGAFSFGAILKQFTDAFSKASQLQDISDRFGLSAEAIQRIGNAAAESGATLDDVAKALAKIGVGAQEAAAGNKQLESAFSAIGVSGQDLVKLSPEQLFYRLANAMNDGSLAGKDMAVAKELLGRGFATLMPVLKMTEEQIRAVGEAAGIMSDDAVAKLDQFGDSWGRLSNTVKVRAAEIMDASIRLGEELMANPMSFFGDWQEIEKNIEERSRKDKEAREAMRRVQPESGETTDPAAAERQKQQAAEKTSSIYERADRTARQNFLNSLNDADRLVELSREEAAQREKISRMADGPERAQAVLENITLAGQIDSLRKRVQEQITDGMIPGGASVINALRPRGSFQVLADSLQQVGGGGRFAQIGDSVQRDQLTVLKNIEKNTAKAGGTGVTPVGVE